MRTAALWSMLLLFVYASVEVGSALGLHALEKLRNVSYKPVEFRLDDSEKKHIRYMIDGRMGVRMLSPELGWTLKPNSSDRFATVNAQGIRGKRVFELAKPPGVTRIATFGDSYTYGSEARDAEVWSEVMRGDDASIEVLNFGVGGYGLDQAYLRYRLEGAAFDPDVVLIGYMSENISRHVNVFRPFYLRPSLPAGKPRFVLEAGELVLLENPLPDAAAYEALIADDATILPRLGERDYHYQIGYRASAWDFLPSVRIAKVLMHEFRKNPATLEIYRDGKYNPDSEAFHVTTAIFQDFYDLARADGSEPVIVIFPHPGDFQMFREDGSTTYDPLLDWLREHELRFVDALDAFKPEIARLELRELFVDSGHYTPRANAMIGLAVRHALESEGLIDADGSAPR